MWGRPNSPQLRRGCCLPEGVALGKGVDEDERGSGGGSPPASGGEKIWALFGPVHQDQVLREAKRADGLGKVLMRRSFPALPPELCASEWWAHILREDSKLSLA